MYFHSVYAYIVAVSNHGRRSPLLPILEDSAACAPCERQRIASKPAHTLQPLARRAREAQRLVAWRPRVAMGGEETPREDRRARDQARHFNTEDAAGGSASSAGWGYKTAPREREGIKPRVRRPMGGGGARNQ